MVQSQFRILLRLKTVFLGNGPGGSPSFLVKGAAGSFETKVAEGLPVGLGVGQPVVLGYTVEFIPAKRTSFGNQFSRMGIVLTSVSLPESAKAGEASPNGTAAGAGNVGSAKVPVKAS